MRSTLYLSLALAACSTSSPSDDGDDTVTGTDPLPRQEGKFVGTYRVPVDNPALEAAASFAVDGVRWDVRGDELTLDYDLPVGLVGGDVSIRMTGSFSSDKVARLSSEQGTATCTAVGQVISCIEVFVDIGVLPIDAELIQQRAALEYSGPALDRVQVANGFASDPIGIVDIDVTQSLPDDEL